MVTVVQVLEKTSSGWWFVERGQDQGWVPESFLELCNSSENFAQIDDGSFLEDEDCWEG